MTLTAPGLLQWAKKRLEYSHVPCAEYDAKAIFMHAFRLEQQDPKAIDIFHYMINLRAGRFPLQYIIKKTEFMGLPFELEPGVFIPRQETELLVEKAIDVARSIPDERVDILEIGTGCGNIAISLTKNDRRCKIVASDISDIALSLASGNASANGVERRIKFVKSDIYKEFALYRNYFHMIISNPPYVRQADIKDLQPEVSYEDKKALDGGGDGYAAYRRIIAGAGRYLRKNGALMLEISDGQALFLKRILERKGYGDIRVSKDYNGLNRVLVAKRTGAAA